METSAGIGAEGDANPAAGTGVAPAAGADRPRPSRRTQRLTLAASCFGLFMGMLDNSVVNVSLPTMQVELHASISGLQWVVDAYVLVFACLVLTGGALGDRFGRKRAFQLGVAVFTVASVLCGLAPTLGPLVAARALQGVGAALMLPNSLSVLVATFPDARQRAQAIGLWAGVSALALGIGPVLGGTLTQTLGWESVFFINLPVGIVALVIAQLVIVESRSPGTGGLDAPGQALAIATLGALTFALIEGNRLGWRSPLILGLFAFAAAGLVAFLRVETHRDDPLLDLRWFRQRRFAGATMLGLVNGFALFGFIFFNGLYFQQVLGYSPAQTGLRLLPNTLTVMVAAPLAGRLAGRFGYRLPVVIGTVIAGGAMLLLTRISPETHYASLWWNLTLLGVGLGLVNSPIVAAAQAALPLERSGTASGMVNSARQTGGLLGIALLGAIVTAVGGGQGQDFVTGLRTGYLLTAVFLFAGTAAAAVMLGADRD